MMMGHQGSTLPPASFRAGEGSKQPLATCPFGTESAVSTKVVFQVRQMSSTFVGMYTKVIVVGSIVPPSCGVAIVAALFCLHG
eukprot:2363483-Amphidinium_carterae.1